MSAAAAMPLLHCLRCHTLLQSAAMLMPARYAASAAIRLICRHMLLMIAAACYDVFFRY